MAKKPLSDQLREAIARSGKTRYRIHKQTGIAESQLSRFVNDSSVGLSLRNIDKLCECIGVELVLKAEHGKHKASSKKPKGK